MAATKVYFDGTSTKVQPEDRLVLVVENGKGRKPKEAMTWAEFKSLQEQGITLSEKKSRRRVNRRYRHGYEVVVEVPVA